MLIMSTANIRLNRHFEEIIVFLHTKFWFDVIENPINPVPKPPLSSFTNLKIYI